MKRKDFIRLSVPAIVLLANGKVAGANEYFLSAEHKRKVKLRFAVASDGHYGQPKTDFAAFHERLVNRINEEHGRHAFDFCVINGDVVHDDKSHYPAAKKALDLLKPKYYVSQGNHDHVTPGEWQAIWNMPVNLDFAINDNAF